MVTMKKVAELCGVSRGTVDRVLHGRGRVSDETAANIRRQASARSADVFSVQSAPVPGVV